MRLTFEEPLPDAAVIGDALAAIGDYAALTIRGCTTHKQIVTIELDT